jgi:S-formylglutathione hydrolase FrmB
MRGLLSPLTIVLALMLTVLAPVTCLLLWNRLGSHRGARLAGRAALVVSCQLLAVLSAGLMLNRHYGFYTSWNELLGRSSLPAVSPAAAPGSLDRIYARQLRNAARSGHGLIVPWVIPGVASGLPARRALVYLPALYGDPAAVSVRFPVLELLHGFPGRPESWTGPLDLQRILDAQITSRQSVPFIAVMPTQNLAYPRDTQCVDVAQGPRVDTYLTQDVRRALLGAVRVTPDRHGWALMGFSTGGYCAVNLALRHPDLYAAAVSLSGYTYPAHDRSTGELFGGSLALQKANTPVWVAAHWRGFSDLSVLLMTSRQDPSSYRDTLELAAVARAPLRLRTVLLPAGGHNARLWKGLEPVAFDWLSRQLVSPLAPEASVGLAPQPPRLARVPRVALR